MIWARVTPETSECLRASMYGENRFMNTPPGGGEFTDLMVSVGF